MLKAGYTAVCEFHYLHSQPDGRPYADPAAMSPGADRRGRDAGIGLTLLPTLYQTSDFGGAPPTAAAAAVRVATRRVSRLLDALRSAHAQSPQRRDRHRAAQPARSAGRALRTVLDLAAATRRSIHIHIAEQEREVAGLRSALGARPIEWLLEHAAVDRRWCLVHATHRRRRNCKASPRRAR